MRANVNQLMFLSLLRSELMVLRSGEQLNTPSLLSVLEQVETVAACLVCPDEQSHALCRSLL